MVSRIETARRRTLQLLNETRAATHSYLSRLEPELVVHHDDRAWRVRDVLGHLGVWNGEAANSLQAYSDNREYYCVLAETQYDSYNGPAADARRLWTLEQVWAEYESSHERLRALVERLPAAKWEGEMLYPWNERGTVEHLIQIMMAHETRDHCAEIRKALG